MQVYRSLFSACAVLAFLALILGLNATAARAQTEVGVDIQLEADGKASTTTEVGAKAGGQVVIEILASGFAGALAVDATFTVSDPSAITAVTGTHKVGLSFPSSPIRNWSPGDSEIKYQSGGLPPGAKEDPDVAGLQVIGEMTLTLSDPFTPFEITLTEIKITVDPEVLLTPNTVLRVTQPRNNLISNIDVIRKHNAATISWTTRYKGTSDVVQYRAEGETEWLSVQGTLQEGATSHSVAITGLTAATKYEYQISSTSTTGELSPETTGTFQTRTTPDTRPVTISNLQLSATTSSVTFTWTTSRLADTRIRIESAGATVAETQTDAEGTTAHSITAENLEQGTAYTATLTSRGVGLDDLITDGLMTEADVTASKTQAFKTKAAAKDLRFNGAPTVTTTDNQATITVRLNQPASVTVDYEPGTFILSYSSSVSSTGNSDVHVFTLSQLDANTTYSFRVTATTDPQLAGQSPPSLTEIVGSSWGVPLSEAKTTITTDREISSRPWSRSLTFKTKRGPGPAPTITRGPNVVAGRTYAIFDWRTNVDTDGKVFLGTLGANGTLGTPDEVEYRDLSLTGTTLVGQRHVIIGTGLSPNSFYGYRIESTSEDGQTVIFDPHNSRGQKPIAAAKFQVVGSDGGFGTSETADTQLPLITRGPTVVNATESSLTIEWDTDEYATSAVTYGLSAESLDEQEINGTPATTHRITLTGLAAGTTYAYRVAVTDISDNGPVQSQIGLATTLDEPDLTAPGFSGTPAPSYTSDTRADIHWATNEFTTGEIAYGLSAGDLDLIITLNELTDDQTAVLTGLTAGTTYYYQISVRDYNGNGPTQSQVLTFETLATADAQAPVISSVVATPTDSAAVVTWTSDEVANSVVLFGLSGSLDNNISDIEPVTDHRIVLSNLTPETTYSYRVQSFDPAGNGPGESEEATFTTLAAGAAQAPAAPEGLTARAGNAAVQLTWSAAASTATALVLERAEGEGEFASIVTLDPVTSYVDNTVVNGTAYRYRLLARGLFQRTGSPSAATEAVTPSETGGPSAPSLFAIQGVQTTPTIVIKNSTPVAEGDVLTYIFQVSTQEDFSDVVELSPSVAAGAGLGAGDPAGLTAYTVGRALTDGTTYFYRAKAGDGLFDSPFLTGSFTVNAAAPAYPGDLTGDLEVGFPDFIAFVRAFNSSSGDPNFDADADINSDGSVGFPDFLAFVRVFNKKYVKGPSGSGKPAVIVAYEVDAAARLDLFGRFVQTDAARDLVVDVRLADATDVQGYGFEVTYDPAALEFVDATDQGETFLRSDGRNVELSGVLDHDRKAGRISVAGAITGGDAVSGAGVLATLRFRPIDPDLEDAGMQIAQGILFDPDFNGLTVRDLGGRFSILPTEYALEHNFPNPFNPETTIRYALPQAGRVALVVYNVLGQEVVRLVDAEQLPGFYTAQWNGKDAFGRTVASGIYIYRFQADAFTKMHKMLLLK